MLYRLLFCASPRASAIKPHQVYQPPIKHTTTKSTSRNQNWDPPKKNRMQKAVVSVKDQCCNDSPGIRFVTLRGPEDLSFSHGKCEQFSRRKMGGGALKYRETYVSTILRAVHFKLECRSSRKKQIPGRNPFLQVSWGHNHIIKGYSTCSPS